MVDEVAKVGDPNKEPANILALFRPLGVWVPPQKRRWFFFGLDEDGDPALFTVCVTWVWYKDHVMCLWGNQIPAKRRQTSALYRAMRSGILEARSQGLDLNCVEDTKHG